MCCLSTMEKMMSSFLYEKANEKMPFIIIVLRRVIRWHGMEHLLCVWMTRRFFFLVSKIDSKRGESFYVEIWQIYEVLYGVKKNATKLYLFIYFHSGHVLMHQDSKYTEKLNTFEFKVQDSKNYRFYWLTIINALLKHWKLYERKNKFWPCSIWECSIYC